jgi:hypothetical protein
MAFGSKADYDDESLGYPLTARTSQSRDLQILATMSITALNAARGNRIRKHFSPVEEMNE